MRRATLGLIALGVIAVDRATKALVDGMDLTLPHQLIGSFQAIQHKLANSLIILEGTRLTIAQAAEACDLGAGEDGRRIGALKEDQHGGQLL
jgi:alkylation response protein AidB-like acyl-CoA dehydrogenase